MRCGPREEGLLVLFLDLTGWTKHERGGNSSRGGKGFKRPYRKRKWPSPVIYGNQNIVGTIWAEGVKRSNLPGALEEKWRAI